MPRLIFDYLCFVVCLRIGILKAFFVILLSLSLLLFVYPRTYFVHSCHPTLLLKEKVTQRKKKVQIKVINNFIYRYAFAYKNNPCKKNCFYNDERIIKLID